MMTLDGLNSREDCNLYKADLIEQIEPLQLYHKKVTYVSLVFPEGEKDAFSNFLKDRSNVFTRSIVNLVGTNPTVIVHSLNVDFRS